LRIVLLHGLLKDFVGEGYDDLRTY